MQEAFDGARRVNDSMIREFANTRQAHPESAFPFSGPTLLKTMCKQVGYAPARWLVLSIVSCSGQFPYDELQVIADNDGRQADPETDIPEDNKIPISRPSGKPSDETDSPRLQSGREPDKQGLPKRLELPGDCFNALLGKKIRKLEKDHCDYKSGQLTTVVEPPPSAHGTGDGDLTKPGIGKVDVAKLNSHALPPSYELLVALVNELKTRSGVTAKLLPLSDGPGLVKARLTAPAGRRQWAYIDYKRRSRRYLMIAEIRAASRYFYLIEIERRASSPSDKYRAELFYSDYYRQFSDRQIDSLVHALSTQEGRVSRFDLLAKLGIYKDKKGMRHLYSEPKYYADRLIEIMQSYR